MKIVIAAFFILFHSTTVFCQRQVASMPFAFDEQSLKNGRYGIFCQENPADHSFSCVLQNGSNTSYALFNGKNELVKKIDVTIDMESPLGGKSSRIHTGMINGAAHVYVCKKTDIEGAVFSMQTVDYNTGEITNKELFTLDGEEIEAGAYTYDNRFYHISVLRNTESVTVRVVAPDGNVTSDVFTVTLPSFVGQTYIPDLSAALARTRPSLMMTPESEENFYYAGESRKIYPGKDIIRLVANWKYFHTYVLTIDLSKKTTTAREFYPYKEQIKNAENTPYLKSIIKDDKVFSLFMYEDKADITVHDLLSGELLNLVTLPSDFSDFAAAPAGFRRNDDEESVSQPKSFAKSLKRFWQTPCLAVVNNGKGFYEISIGGHEVAPIYSRIVNGVEKEKNGPRYQATNWGTPHYWETWWHSARYEQVVYKVMLDAKNFRLATDQKATAAQPEKFQRLIQLKYKNTVTSNPFYLNNKPASGHYKSKTNEFVMEVLD